MAIIYSYPPIGELATGDTIAISDASNGNKTKSVTIGQLSDYFGTSGGGVDNYVNGGSYSSGTLTLTRTGSLPDINISGFFNGQYSSLTGTPTLATVATTGSYNDLSDQPTIPTNNNQLTNGAGYTTNLGVVQALTTTGTSGAATLVGGTLNIPQYSGGGGSAYTTLTRTLTGSEIVNAFNGNLSDSITLVSVPAGKLGIIREVVYIIKGATTGTTNYNANNSLYILPQGAQNPNAPGWAVQINDFYFNSGFDWVGCNIETSADSNLSDRGGTGADIILGVATGGTPVNITQGDRDVVISLTYRILDF